MPEFIARTQCQAAARPARRRRPFSRYKPHFVSLTLTIVLLAVGCRPAPASVDPVVEAATPTALQPSPTATDAPPTVTPAPTRTPSPVETSTPAVSPTPAPFVCSDPRLAELQDQGYTQVPLERFAVLPPSNPGSLFFDNQGRLHVLRTGGPTHDEPGPPDRLSVTTAEGKTYTYLQYCSSSGDDCHLLFAREEGGEQKLIGDVEAAKLSERIGRGNMGIDAAMPMPPFCLPYDWADLNENGRPDIAVTLVWANNYTGGEVHIFEVQDDDTVVDLTRDLPGPMSHWDFDPNSRVQIVIDDAWAQHDCIYPRSPFSFWLYEWDDRAGAFVDVTSSGRYNVTETDYAAALEEVVSQHAAFVPQGHIGPLVTLLLLHDKAGQREAGWQKFLELADESNWPGSDQEALDWLRADVAHFKKQYEAGVPFTPNKYGCDD